jgi:hypothetical protein
MGSVDVASSQLVWKDGIVKNAMLTVKKDIVKSIERLMFATGPASNTFEGLGHLVSTARAKRSKKRSKKRSIIR